MSDALALFAAVRDERGSIVDFRYEFINEAGCRLNLRSREEHIGRTLLELFPAHRDSPLLGRYAQVVETGVAFVDEGVDYEDVYGEGRRLARSYYVHVAKWGDGFAVSWRDTTERRRLEEELQSHREDLEQRVAERTSELREAVASIARESAARRLLEEQFRHAQKMEAVGRLAGGVAHDFNNLLGVVLGYAELLASELTDDSPQAEMMREITNAAQKAVHLTRQLLTFSRRQAIQPRRVEVGALLTGVAGVLRQLIGERVRLEIHAQPDLWAVTADVGSLEQVVMNLAVNACDAMPSGGTLSIVANNVALDGSGTARQLHAAEGPHVRLAVRDTGTGMDEETRSRMFEPFFTTKEREHGTGLGLATVYAIVEQHRGFIAVETAPGQGTLFEIFLPVAAASEEEDEPARWSSTPAQTAGTVLLVEDDDALRKLASELLQRSGYVVLEGRDAAEARAIERSHAGHIDLLLTDLGLPDDSGQELAEDVARRRPGMAVLYTSGHADGVIARHGVPRRDMLLLEKPYSRSTLLARVEQTLETSRRDRKGPATRS